MTGLIICLSEHTPPFDNIIRFRKFSKNHRDVVQTKVAALPLKTWRIRRYSKLFNCVCVCSDKRTEPMLIILFKKKSRILVLDIIQSSLLRCLSARKVIPFDFANSAKILWYSMFMVNGEINGAHRFALKFFSCHKIILLFVFFFLRYNCCLHKISGSSMSNSLTFSKR